MFAIYHYKEFMQNKINDNHAVILDALNITAPDIRPTANWFLYWRICHGGLITPVLSEIWQKLTFRET